MKCSEDRGVDKQRELLKSNFKLPTIRYDVKHLGWVSLWGGFRVPSGSQPSTESWNVRAGPGSAHRRGLGGHGLLGALLLHVVIQLRRGRVGFSQHLLPPVQIEVFLVAAQALLPFADRIVRGSIVRVQMGCRLRGRLVRGGLHGVGSPLLHVRAAGTGPRGRRSPGEADRG